MILTEEYITKEDQKSLVRTYSSEGMMIRQRGSNGLYEEAIDPEDSGRTYTETDIPIEEPEEVEE